eukprot:CAMPEP_0168709268 /NCGR_PEP_ID=MMETSP0503-20121227/42047_1 /TAXON_ID=89963 /ORGANISM="Heterocapsa rotundata, Strain SCCAP K-0483" /LENGTH=65 /DNA_ID=CAMNT_0008755589 /DNA_START=31 /DNA_END=224 /DNA_ORIENTATION=+
MGVGDEALAEAKKAALAKIMGKPEKKEGEAEGDDEGEESEEDSDFDPDRPVSDLGIVEFLKGEAG